MLVNATVLKTVFRVESQVQFLPVSSFFFGNLLVFVFARMAERSHYADLVESDCGCNETIAEVLETCVADVKRDGRKIATPYDWCKKLERGVDCKKAGGQPHTATAVYTRNSRDVDLLELEVDGKKIGQTFM